MALVNRIPGKMGIGVVIEWINKKPEIISKGIGHGTNNIAEYSALLEALLQIKNKEIKVCTIHSDSNLMVQQTVGTWKCNDATLKELNFKAKKRIEWLRENGFKVDLVYTRREFNLADEPAKRGCSMNK